MLGANVLVSLCAVFDLVLTVFFFHSDGYLFSFRQEHGFTARSVQYGCKT
jgi:hypothetical protein